MATSLRGGLLDAAGGAGRGLGAVLGRVRGGIVAAGVSVLQGLRRVCTPFRLIVATMAVVLLATAGVAIRSQLKESARETLRAELAAGQEQLAESNFVQARGHFARAAEAVRTLGTHDDRSRLAEQLHRETTAMTQLAPGSLFDLLSEAEAQQQRPGHASWEDIFHVRYEGTWLVLHAPVRRDEQGHIVGLPLTVGDDARQVLVRADLPSFDRLVTGDDAIPVVFAAPIKSCTLDEHGHRWEVTLDADQGFLWSTLDNLRPLGLLDGEWTDTDELAKLLTSQSNRSGGER